MTTADAPAVWAFVALMAKVQAPRWISAMLPGVNAGEFGREAQPGPATALAVMWVVRAVTSPEPE